MTDVLGNWPVTGNVTLIGDSIVTGDFFGIAEAIEPGKAAVSFIDTAQTPNATISFDANLAGDGQSLSGETTVNGYRYLVTAMVETVGSPSVFYRTISGTVLRKGGGTEDSGGQWNGGPLRPK